MSNKIQYTVGKLDLNLKSATNMITVSKGDTIEFEPVVNAKILNRKQLCNPRRLGRGK